MTKLEKVTVVPASAFTSLSSMLTQYKNLAYFKNFPNVLLLWARMVEKKTYLEKLLLIRVPNSIKKNFTINFNRNVITTVFEHRIR